MTSHLTIGLLLNPIAGLGGPTGLKGTDGVVDEALRRGGTSRVQSRVADALKQVQSNLITWKTLPDQMGAAVLSELGIDCELIGEDAVGGEQTTADDTRRGVQLLEQAGID